MNQKATYFVIFATSVKKDWLELLGKMKLFHRNPFGTNFKKKRYKS
jgi:hypothetical protein